MKIAPSILNADLLDLKNILIDLQKEGVSCLHLDVMDGHFVPNMTVGHNIIPFLKKYFRGRIIAHLMVDNPERFIKNFAGSGADYITVHSESPGFSTGRLLWLISGLGIHPGLAVNPGTDIKKVEKYLDKTDLITIMSVYPGLGGQKFREASIRKIERLSALRRGRGLKFLIEVDGGITPEKIPVLKTAGVDIAVVGYYIFSDRHYISRIRKLNKLMGVT